MAKRAFLQTVLGGLGAAATLPLGATTTRKPTRAAAAGPALFTVSGQIGRGNRGPLDPALDRLLAKQNVAFDKAHTFDAAALAALPQARIEPTLEYDGRRHTLEGPLLLDVIKATGARVGQTALLLRAIDGYAVLVEPAELDRRRFVLATHLDGQPMALGGLGPLWAVYDADRFADLAAKPLKARFSLCPWAVYHAEVRAP